MAKTRNSALGPLNYVLWSTQHFLKNVYLCFLNKKINQGLIKNINWWYPKFCFCRKQMETSEILGMLNFFFYHLKKLFLIFWSGHVSKSGESKKKVLWWPLVANQCQFSLLVQIWAELAALARWLSPKAILRLNWFLSQLLDTWENQNTQKLHTTSSKDDKYKQTKCSVP